MNRRLRDLKLMIPDIAACLAPASADTFAPACGSVIIIAFMLSLHPESMR
jgi:hypothetical protein